MMNKRTGVFTLRVIGACLSTSVMVIVFLFTIGYLEVRARAAVFGIKLDWLDEPIAVIGIQRPWSQHLGIALVTAGAIFALMIQPQFTGKIWSRLPIITAGVVLAIFVIYYNVTTSSPYFGSLTPMLALGVPSNVDLPQENLLNGWLKMGSLSVSALVLMLTLIVRAFFNPFPDHERRQQNAH